MIKRIMFASLVLAVVVIGMGGAVWAAIPDVGIGTSPLMINFQGRLL